VFPDLGAVKTRRFCDELILCYYKYVPVEYELAILRSSIISSSSIWSGTCAAPRRAAAALRARPTLS